MESVLSPKAIEFGYMAADWSDAVRRAGGLLVKAGVVETPYIEAMVDMVKDYGPYMVVAPGVAMPHAHSGKGVKSTGISYLRLARPVFFPERPDNPIVLIMAVAAMDNSSHLEVMGRIAELILDGSNREALLSCEDPEKICQSIDG